MEINDIDDILQDLGMSSTPSPAPSPTPTPSPQEDEGSAFSNEEIDDILQENGFASEAEGDLTNSNDGEGREEDEENNEYLARQGADTAEEEDPEYLNALAEAEQEEDYEPEEGALDDAGNEEVESSIQTDENIERQETSKPAVTLPLNSPTLLMDDTTTRFSGAEWFKEVQKQRIIIGGCGGIGSNLAFQLARMSPANITIYDDDTVETVNMAGQLFSHSDTGLHKVDAIVGMIQNYTSMRNVYAIRDKFTNVTQAGNVMMSGFDNMRARKVFFEVWYNHLQSKNVEERAKCLLLDGRLSMDTLQIFCIRGDDDYNINRYRRKFLFNDYEAEATVCSMKQTTYLACMIGSLMVNLFTNFVAGQLSPVIPYDLPFFLEYDAQNMLFKTEN